MRIRYIFTLGTTTMTATMCGPYNEDTSLIGTNSIEACIDRGTSSSINVFNVIVGSDLVNER